MTLLNYMRLCLCLSVNIDIIIFSLQHCATAIGRISTIEVDLFRIESTQMAVVLVLEFI